MIQIGITYDVVTPESAEHGDFAESGWELETQPWKPGMLREILKDFRFYHVEPSGYPFQPSDWWTAYNVTEGSPHYYETGEEQSRSLHISGITASTAHRINRLLTS